ncbi:MAG: hypothetical protein A2Y00_00365 [Omnitrophica WOR_2 bacterium GWF2_43_52]|nr:MAG: hypothetical protein A2Y00_00365 [Omnitrophica WOR_2 bacterium GWF2_43_52]
MMEGIRIGVVMGGVSSERDVSLKSGKAVAAALKSRGSEALEIDIKKADKQYARDLLLSYDIGLAFLALHGSFGEDGKIQSILEEIGIPYTGSGPRASALAMDKIASRKIFQDAGLLCPRYYSIEKNRKNSKSVLTFPLVVKPAGGGSSIGLSIVENQTQLKGAIDEAFRYDRKVIVEEYIAGRELTVGIFEDSPLEAIEIKPKRRFFDYRAKYEPGQTEYCVPAALSLELMRVVKEAAYAAHEALGCSFFSRVDIILRHDNTPFILEVNTIPGFTATSLLPKAALYKGIPFPELIVRISEAALSGRADQVKINARKVTLQQENQNAAIPSL